MNRWSADDEQMMIGWWADDERMMCWWWADDELMMSGWWADDERMMSEWWADDEQMMSGLWADDEQMKSGWWADDERRMSRWTDDWLWQRFWIFWLTWLNEFAVFAETIADWQRSLSQPVFFSVIRAKHRFGSRPVHPSHAKNPYHLYSLINHCKTTVNLSNHIFCESWWHPL